MKKIIFLHRSVGENLINDGAVYKLLQERADISFCDFNQNTSLLRDNTGTQKTSYQMPGSNTTPHDFAALFRDDYQSPLKDFVMQHDVIIIKSCYPNSNIKSTEDLQHIKNDYASIAQFFASYPAKQLIIMTSPPLVPLMTSAANATRARELATWLSLKQFGSNITVFNFFDHLAADSGHHSNMLRPGYRRLLPFDSHPNRRASQVIAPTFVSSLVRS